MNIQLFGRPYIQWSARASRAGDHALAIADYLFQCLDCRVVLGFGEGAESCMRGACAPQKNENDNSTSFTIVMPS
jgi:hypothetical protein